MPQQQPPDAPGTPPATAPRKKASGGRSVAGGYTARTWARALLQRMGFPVTAANLSAIVSWEAAEGGHWNNTAHYNPLNTTQDAPGATSMNSVGVKAYTSWQEGLDATVQTLRNGNYGHILDALKSGNNAEAVAQAVVNSPWGTKQISIGGHSTYGRGASSYLGQNDVAASGDSGATAPTKPLSTKDYLSQNIDGQYGYLSAFLHNKEIGPIIARAAKNGWSQQRMLSALEKTDWWQKTSQSARSWEALQRTDPATAHQQLQQMRQQIRQLSKSTLGAALDDKRINQLANTAIAANWSQGEIQKAIGAEFHYHGAQQTYQGAAGQTITQLQQMAKQYVVPLSHDTLQRWTRQILEGTFTTDDFQSYLTQQAESLYPTLSSALKSGQTTRQYADPYLQVASQLLERPADSFDLSDPKWNKALLQPQPDGSRKPMELSDWASYIRSLPAYAQTAQAKSAAADFGLALGNIFGKVASPYQGSLAPTAMTFGSS